MQTAKQLQLIFIAALSVFIGGMLALNVYTLNLAHQQAVQQGLDDAATQARSFEHFLTQSLNVMELLGNSTVAQHHRAGIKMETAFADILRDTPLIRSISLLDAQGRITLSSNPANVGQSVDTANFWPPGGEGLPDLRIGPPWSGRDVANGSPSTPKAPVEVGHIYFIPLVHTVQTPQRTERVLLTLNPDYLLNNLLQSHPPRDGSTAVRLYDGTLLLDSAPDAQIGSRDAPLLQQLGLPDQEYGTHERNVSGERPMLTAFRASSLYPVVIQTQSDRGNALQAWRDQALRLNSVLIIALLLVFGIAYAFYRRQLGLVAQRAELTRQQQLNAKVFHASTDGILICDAQANIISVNQAFTRITGYPAPEVLGKNPRLLASGQQPRAFYAAMWSHLLQHDLWEGELINRRADGTHFHAQISITVSRNGAGQIRHYIGTLRDISQLHHAQTELSHSETRFRSLTALSSDWYWEQNAQFELKHLSDDLEAKTGLSPAGLIGLAIHDLPFRNLTPEQRSAHRALLDAHRPFQNLEVQLPDHAQQPNWAALSGTPIFDDAGEFSGYRGVGTNITERKLAQLELERALGRLQKVASRVPGVIYEFRVRPDGSTAFPYNSDPAKATQMAGISSDILLQDASSLLASIHPDDYPAVATTLRASARKLTPWRHEYRLRYPDARVRWVLCNAIPEREEDGSTLWYGYVSDITEQKLIETAMTESHNLLMTVINTSPLRIFWKDLDSRFLGCNKAFADDWEFDTPQAVMGLKDDDFLPADLAEHCRSEDRAVIQSGQPKLFYNEAQTLADGRTIWRRTSRAPLKGQQGQIIGVLGVYEDITEAKHTEDKLHLAASVFAHSREGIMITATDGTIIDINDAFTNITGYSRDEMVGKNPRILNSGRQPKEFYAAMWHDLTHKGHWYGEVWNRRKSGDVYAEMQTISTVFDADGQAKHFVSLFSDITANKEHERQLEHIAHYDALTGLPNRVLLADRLQQGMNQAQRRERLLAVAFLDLDAFKSVNDTHGHEVGDDLLIALATRMRQTLREGDTLARIGGDEFVAVLGDLPDVSSSLPMLTRLLAAAAQPVETGDLTLQLSASLGVTFYPQTDAVDADQLMRQADQAMYQAKLAGKNRYHVFDAEQDRSVRGHHESVERIRLALVQQEFVLYFQPKVNMRSGQIIGAEALIRWQHPDKGLLSPAVFLPIIEDHPLAIEVGEWVLNAALQQMTHWRESDALTLPVSVNIGARQLQQPSFSEHLRDILLKHPQVKPGNLELEVLETSALEDLTGVSLVIDACRALGVNFALDDFGTGYSSLTYLKRLPVSMLKIDQSFVRDMLDDPDDLAILQGVIGLASAFRRQVIAEGVETIDHGTTLLQLGCELAQGYGIARPMPAQALPGWCATWTPDPSWSGQSVLERDALPLLFAKAELRAWVSALDAFLNNERQFPPALPVHECQLGQWLTADAVSRFASDASDASFAALDASHHALHDLALELVAWHQAHPGQSVHSQRSNLYAQRDQMQHQLDALIQRAQSG